MEPMNAPILALNNDGVHTPESFATDWEHAKDYIVERMRPIFDDHTVRGEHSGTCIAFSPFTAPEDVRFELRKAANANAAPSSPLHLSTNTTTRDRLTTTPPAQTAAAANAADGSTSLLSSATSSITSAFDTASHWVRDRLNSSPHVHTHKQPHATTTTTASPIPVARDTASRLAPSRDAQREREREQQQQQQLRSDIARDLKDARDGCDNITGRAEPHGHVDLFHAASHRIRDDNTRDEHGHPVTRLSNAALPPAPAAALQQQQRQQQPSSLLSSSTAARGQRNVPAVPLRDERSSPASHEYLHSKMLVGHRSDEPASLLSSSSSSRERLREPLEPRESLASRAQVSEFPTRLTAPAMGVEVDMSDGLAEAGAVLGRALLGSRTRGPTIHATESKSAATTA